MLENIFIGGIIKGVAEVLNPKIETKRGRDTIIDTSLHGDDEYIGFTCVNAREQYTIPHHLGGEIIIESIIGDKGSEISQWQSPDSQNFYVMSEQRNNNLKIKVKRIDYRYPHKRQ